jgi:signal transduction histidine kinase
MWPLTIRTRVAVSYGVVIVGVLGVVTVAVGAVHTRLGLARVDADLAAAMLSVAGVVASEMNERFSLGVGANEALIELDLPGLGVMVLDGDRQILARRVSGAPPITPERLESVVAGDPPRTLEPERVRVAASHWRHGPDAYIVVTWTSLAAFDRDHATVRNTLRDSVPLAGLAALVGGWLIVWRALRPLTRMAATADGIDQRQLDARLPVPVPSDEVRTLAVAFNALLDRLAAVVGAQRRFMADASHELRTPVTVARTAAQVTLSAPLRTDAEYREALEIVASQTERLSHLVDDMFLLTLADVGGRRLELRYVYLDDLASECVRSVGVLAAERRLRLHLDTPPGVQIQGDEELLRRMLLNLLDNAVRYAPENGEVRVALRRTGDTATITVQDSGPGIPAGQRERVFERFVRLEPSRHTSGGGLGLPIARWIAEQHHGTLTLDPACPSGFVVRLPIAPSAEPSLVAPATSEAP